MTRNVRTLLVLSALLSPALATTTLAADWQVTQTGENFDGVWSGAQRDNLVGGGAARMAGGGDDSEIAYSGRLQAGRPVIATLSGGGEDAVLAYTTPAGSQMSPLFVANASGRY